MFELVENMQEGAVLKVIGVGGGGGNAIKHMIANNVQGVHFLCANTDVQALSDVDPGLVLQLGATITKGLGAGSNPDIGRAAAMEDRERIADALSGADMVFIAAGMGGGTGTGAAPVVAEIAHDMGILSVAVVSRPFLFEGKKRWEVAERGIQELAKHVDSLITVPNQKLLDVMDKKAPIMDAFKAVNDVLLGAVQGIADLIVRPGVINVDFADVRTVMSEMGMAMMGSGCAMGDNRAREAAEKAIHSPLLEDINLQGAKGILVNITAGMDFSVDEFRIVGDTVEEFAAENATLVTGMSIDPEMSEDFKVTIVATGLGKDSVAPPMQVVEDNTEIAVPKAPLKQERIKRPLIRQNSSRAMGQEALEPTAAVGQEEYFDIPAFLRGQVD